MKTKKISWFIHIVYIFGLYLPLLTKYLKTLKKLNVNIDILLHYLCFDKQLQKFDMSVMFNKIQMLINTDKSRVFSSSECFISKFLKIKHM